MLAKIMFISLVLFQFCCFALSVEAFKQFTPKSMYSDPTISYVNHAKRVLFVLNMH